MPRPQNKKKFFAIFLLSFASTLAFALPTYSQSSFLEALVGINQVGFYLAIATTLTFLAILIYPTFIRYSNYLTMLVVLALSSFCLLYLPQLSELWLVLGLFVIQFVCLRLLGINLDVALEAITDNRQTGTIRSTFLTLGSLAFVASPILMSQLVSRLGLSAPYFASGILLLPVIVILITQRRVLSVPILQPPKKNKIFFTALRRKPDLKKIFLLQFTLQFFYAIMVLFTPIYLRQLGFNWENIGVLFTIMLVPFLLFELPAGRIADRFLGEKEILVAGIIIMAAAAMAIFLIQTPAFLIWAVVLFASRTGAALTEIMIETHFFKQVNTADLEVITLFRSLQPTGWLLASVVSLIVLAVLPVNYIFLLLVFWLLISLGPALTFKDSQ